MNFSFWPFLWFGLPGRLLSGEGHTRGLLGTGPPDPTLESVSPSPPQGSIWHRFNIDSTSISWFILFRCRIDVESMLNQCQILPNKALAALIIVSSFVKIQGKTKGQQLKGKLVSEFFTLFALFHPFSEFLPQVFPLQNKGFSLNESKREEKIRKRTGQIDVAR